MSRVMMWCVPKNRATFTGLELDHSEPLTGLWGKHFTCSQCGEDHAFRNLFFEEDGPGEVGGYFTALDGMPEFAAEIGKLISMIANIESGFPLALRRLTGLTYGDATVIMDALDGFGQKTRMLKLIARHRDKPIPGMAVAPAVAELDDLLPLLNEANSIRNRLAHATYGFTGRTTALVMPYRSDIDKRKIAGFNMDLERLLGDVRTLRRAAVAMSRYTSAL
jgi:hypothetical protein